MLAGAFASCFLVANALASVALDLLRKTSDRKDRQMILTAIGLLLLLGVVGFLVAMASGLVGWPLASYIGDMPRWALVYLLPAAGLSFAVAALAYLMEADRVGRWALAIGIGLAGGVLTAWVGHRMGGFLAKFAKL